MIIRNGQYAFPSLKMDPQLAALGSGTIHYNNNNDNQ